MPALDEQILAATARHRAGAIDQAVEMYRKILTEEPNNPDALHMLGVIAQQKGNSSLALNLIEAALALKPDLALAWNNRALILRVLGRHKDALTSNQEALNLNDALAGAWDLRGSLLLECGQTADALRALAEACRLDPANPHYAMNHAHALMAEGDFIRALKIANTLEGEGHPHTALLLGNIMKAAGYPEQALLYYSKEMASFPKETDSKLNCALAHLQMGDLKKGWALWEERPDRSTQFGALPYWRGEETKHLILYEDQGSGDLIQCVRYIPLLRDKAEKITLFTTRSLKNLIKMSFPSISVHIEEDGPILNGDTRMRLMSLPSRFSQTLDGIPTSVPYLRACDVLRQKWRARLSTLPQPRLGIVWGGNPSNPKDKLRSIPFFQLKSLCQKFASHIVSLQKGPQKSENDLVALKILDADAELIDFSETSALMMELDLVISVDTSTVHLAGALGVPTWMPTPFDPDFRWLLGREDSPWYPRLRLFRQRTPRTWDSVIMSLEENIGALLSGNTNVLVPTPYHGAPFRQDPHAVSLENNIT